MCVSKMATHQLLAAHRLELHSRDADKNVVITTSYISSIDDIQAAGFSLCLFSKGLLRSVKTDPSKYPKIGQKANVSRDFLGSDAWGRKKEAF